MNEQKEGLLFKKPDGLYVGGVYEFRSKNTHSIITCIGLWWQGDKLISGDFRRDGEDVYNQLSGVEIKEYFDKGLLSLKSVTIKRKVK